MKIHDVTPPQERLYNLKGITERELLILKSLLGIVSVGTGLYDMFVVLDNTLRGKGTYYEFFDNEGEPVFCIRAKKV